MKTIKNKVKQLLIKNPTNRDSDNKLIANFWYYECKKKNIDFSRLSAFEFLELYSKSKLTNAESIRRMRAKLQEAHEELRGNKYHLRKTTIQNNVRKDLGYETN